MRLSLLSFSLLAACSSSSTPSVEGGSDPIAYESAASDFSLLVLANARAERIVQGSATTATFPKTCTTETVAGCKVTKCGKAGEPTPGTPIGAGALTVTSKSFGDHVELPVMSGYFRLIQSGDFGDDEDVQITSTGGADVPAFDIHVTVPGQLEPKTLGPCGPGTATCPLTDLRPVIEWTGGARTYVQIGFTPTLDTEEKTSASCVFDGSAGKGRIPDGVLAKLPAGTYDVSLVGLGTKVVSGKMGVVPQRWTSGHFPPVKIGG